MPLQATLRCEPGELLALVGPSGAGKTSVLRVLAGLMRPQCGSVVVGGDTWCDTQRGVWLPPQRRHVGLVFQHYALMPHLSALGNVALSLLHLPPPERERQARHWLDHVGLSADQQGRRPVALSGGQQQRLCIARTIAVNPRVILMDEPCSALDPIATAKIEDLMNELKESYTIVIVTHSMQQAARISQQTAFFHLGKVIEYGVTEQIFTNPKNQQTQDYITGRYG
jgi:molybdate transport system ATP-binding protein